MILGLMALGAVWFISKFYELYTLGWILHLFFDYLFIIVIVLFQDQIRSALVSFSGTKFLGKGQKSKLDHQIEEVIDAAMILAKEKTGALIVFEKFHGLLNYSLTGTKLDANIHSDLLYSLFQPISPLHDGAVVIYNGVIQSAGCLLPLSKSSDLDRQYGTRHRAALGVTEVSDAVVLIVSEETGKISLCYNTKFYPIKSEEQLRRDLRNFLLDIEHMKANQSSKLSRSLNA